ncbi:MAG: GGDEF domain-containing protein [Candidatus ainarchaeum sp.]|nr:GGDEF domain-containing protein [Candidatus ainarchaeum sp.]
MGKVRQPNRNLRHHERRITRTEHEVPEQLDRRANPSNTPMGAAQRIETITNNYPELLLQARRDKASRNFVETLKQRYETMRIRHLHRLVSFSERDEGTGLLNKRGFKLRARHYVTNPDRVFSYVYIDMNNLKKINDEFGHGLGNTYLSVMGLAATELARKHEGSDTKFTMGRTGGDEFEMLVSCPRARGYDYYKITTELVNELYNIAKQIWLEQKENVSRSLKMDVPDLEFASGFNIGAKPCPIAIKNVLQYSGLTPEKIEQIDQYLDDLKSAAEKKMYIHKAEMKKNGNGRQ